MATTPFPSPTLLVFHNRIKYLDNETLVPGRRYYQHNTAEELTGMQYKLLELEFVLVVDKVCTLSAYFYPLFTSGRRFGSFWAFIIALVISRIPL